jgi:branched-subunit amino acid ABC-type transport system permease component
VTSTFPGIQTIAVLIVIVGILLVRPQGLLGKSVA